MTLYPVGCYNGRVLKRKKRRFIMSSGVGVQKAEGVVLAGQEIKSPWAQYLAQQPASKQAFHKWMRVVEMGGLAIIAAWLALALYVSINYTAFPGTTIAAAWFAFPVSIVPLMVLDGLHTIVLRASVPSVMPGKRERFVTGSKAAWSGWALIATAVAAGAFWGPLAFAVWSFDMALIGIYVQILGRVLAIVIPGAIVLGVISSLYRQFVRPR
jgi:hypothetical protein